MALDNICLQRIERWSYDIIISMNLTYKLKVRKKEDAECKNCAKEWNVPFMPYIFNGEAEMLTLDILFRDLMI